MNLTNKNTPIFVIEKPEFRGYVSSTLISTWHTVKILSRNYAVFLGKKTQKIEEVRLKNSKPFPFKKIILYKTKN